MSKKQLLFIITLCIATISYSQSVGDTFTYNFLTYEVTSVSPNIAKITDYDINGGTSVGIPGNAIFNGDIFAVNEIGNGAFNNKGLTSVGIGDNIISIGISAFANNLLTSFNIPESITTISELCFQNNQLTNIAIPNGITLIQDGAFENNALTAITIPQNVSIIEGNVFIGNPLTSITSVSVTPAAIITGSEDSFAANRNSINLTIPSGTTSAYTAAQWTGFNSVTEASPLGVGDTFIEGFITYKITSISPNEVETHDYDHYNGSTDVVIPSSTSYNGTSYSVTGIGQSSFEYDGGNPLTSVVIPNSVTQIGPVAFAFNMISNNVIIPDGVTTIEHEIFRENSLTSIIIPDSVTFIGFEAFQENALTTVTLGNSVVEIQDDAFATNQITSINLPNSLTTVGARAFINNQLTTVTIPGTITSLGNSIFRDNQLTSVTIENGITTIPSDTFLNNQLQSVTFPNSIITISQTAFENNQLTSINLNENVTTIDSAAFRNNLLTTIYLPSSITTFGTRVFLGNPLTSITSANTTPPTIYTGGTLETFSSNRGNIDLIIPTGTTGAYVTDPGALWTGFNTVTEDAGLGISDFEIAHHIKVITTPESIQISSSNDIQLKKHTLYNISGQLITTGSNSEITTSAMAHGVYVLKLDFDKGSITKKIIIY